MVILNSDIKQNRIGKVYIVGFGPGNPDLLTIKGERILCLADIIYCDDLIDRDFLENYPARKVYVGKRKGKHSKEQDEINRLLYTSAIEGKKVVRLKGGDPMVFARVGEELAYLQERSVEVEVVPGVTAASAAAAQLKFPLTMRNISSVITIATGHPVDGIVVPSTGTAIYYMCATVIHEIARKWLSKGKSPETPVLLAHNISWDNENYMIKNLQEVANDDKPYPSPLLAIIGEVVDRSI